MSGYALTGGAHDGGGVRAVARHGREEGVWPMVSVALLVQAAIDAAEGDEERWERLLAVAHLPDAVALASGAALPGGVAELLRLGEDPYDLTRAEEAFARLAERAVADPAFGGRLAQWSADARARPGVEPRGPARDGGPEARGAVFANSVFSGGVVQGGLHVGVGFTVYNSPASPRAGGAD
ncbi:MULTISPECIES: hypothetical protein [Streptomyces]|uniref:hypothetical protein n=1 Tax=Streptomyces TaxID=1883 RepID=UPI0022491BF4|nr:hypothetical protein [Streptomyces sp. JHD 1]MCX2968028.1 hypothetical protein [Streptomyces sp. JHD 1]